MKKLKLQNKTMFSLTMVISLLSVFVCAISTFAWFQINSQPVQTSLKTGTGNISFVEDEIYGYKVNPEIGANGKINYDNDTVTKKNGSTISTSNSNQEGQDINFDIPDQGIGYYLIQQNSSNTYTYNSDLATKFVDKTSSSTVNSHYIASKALIAGKNYRVKKYTFENNKTVYEQVPISTTKSTSIITLNNTGVNATYDFRVNTAGTYKIWLIYSSATDSWDLTLEATSYSISELNQASISSKPKKSVTTGNSSSNTFIKFDVTSYINWGGINTSSFWLEYWLSNGNHDFNGTTSTWIQLSTNYYVTVPSSATGAIIQFSQNDHRKNGYFDIGALNLNADNFYTITLSGASSWYYRDGEPDYDDNNKTNSFNVESVTLSSLSADVKSITIYCDTDWLTTWSGTVTNPQIEFPSSDSIDCLISRPNNSTSMSGNIGDICSYSFKFYGDNPIVKFTCVENGTSKSTVDLTMPSVSNGDKLYIILSTTWSGDKMNATIGKQSSASGSNYTVYLFDPLGYKNSASFYCYAWKSGAQVNPYSNGNFPGTTFTTTSTTNLYSATLPTNLFNVDFSSPSLINTVVGVPDILATFFK